MMVVSIAAPISDAKLEALLSAGPTAEVVGEPEVIGKKPEEGAEEVPAAKGGAKSAAPAADVKDEKKEEKGKDTKGEKKK